MKLLLEHLSLPLGICAPLGDPEDSGSWWGMTEWRVQTCRVGDLDPRGMMSLRD